MVANQFKTPAQILEGVSAIALQIQQSAALETVLQTALDATRSLLQTDRVLLYRILPTGDSVVAMESVGREWAPLLGQWLDDPYVTAPWFEHYQQGYTNAIDELSVHASDDCEAERLTWQQQRASLTVPLFVQGTLWGLLIAHHCQSARAWHPLDVQCLQMLALQLGVAIQLEPRLQERLLGAIASNLPGAIYRAVYSPEGNLSSLFFSDSYRALLGYEPQVLMAHPERTLELIHPDDRPRFFEALKAAAETLTGGYLEYRLLTASGDVLWVRDHAGFSRGQQGELIVDGMHLDISDRKRSEDALRQSEARKSALISALPDLIMRVDHNGYYLEFLATTTFRVVGKTGDFVGTHVYDSLPLDLAAKRMDAIGTALQTRSIQFYEQAMLVDGEIQTEEVRVVPYQSNEVLLLVRDITDRKQAEAALRESEERSRLAFEAAQMGSWDWNLITNEVVWAESLERLTGMQPGTFDGRFESTMAIVHPDDRQRVLKAMAQSIEQGDAYDLEFRFMKPDGSIRWAVGKGNVLRDAAGLPVRMLGVDVDVTDHKQAEAALRESEERSRLAFEAAQMGSWDWNITTNEIVWSESLERLMGMQPGTFNRRFETVIAMIYPDDRERVATSITRSVEQGDTYDLEFRFVKPDGSLRWAVSKGNVLRDASGAPIRMLGVDVDVTDRKQAEIALWQRAEREQAISRVVRTIRQSLDLNTILTAAATEIGQLLEVEQAVIVQYLPERQCWLHVVTYRREPSIPNHQGLEILDEDNPFAAQLKRREIVKVIDETIKDDINQNLAQSTSRNWLMVPVIVSDTVWGSFNLCSSQKSLCQEAQVEVVRASADQLAIAIQQAALYQQVQALNMDLERQVQERTAQLHQALNFEALLKRITDHVRDSLDETQILQTAVQELAIELAIDCCDAALYDMEHRTSTICYEYIQKQVSAAAGSVIPFDQNPELYQQVLRGQVVHCCITSLVVDTHRNIEQSASILVCPLVDERGVLGDMWLFKPPQAYFEELEIRLVRQVANQCAIALRQSRLYQAAQAQVEELERLNQLKDDFLSTVSHELRTPMSNIKMATQMLELSLRPLGVLDNEANPIYRYFNILREEGQREIGLINDLLDLARIDASVEPLLLSTIALPPFLAHIAEPFLGRTQKQQQQLIIKLPEKLPPLTTDRAYLERILTELLQNACKYTPAGESITLSAKTTGTALEICVANSGVMIPAIECDRIFDKFYRIPNNDPWKHGGTGLGLTLVQKLTERLEATIRVASSNNQTAFILKFLDVV